MPRRTFSELSSTPSAALKAQVRVVQGSSSAALKAQVRVVQGSSSAALKAQVRVVQGSSSAALKAQVRVVQGSSSAALKAQVRVVQGSSSAALKAQVRVVQGSSSAALKAQVVADWWRTNTLYYDCSGRPVSSSVLLAREHHVRQPLRLLFGLKSIKRVVKKRMNSGAFPLDENGVYFVIGDGSVAQRDNQGGMCSAYCGWHDFVRIRKKLIKVAYVGSPVKCPTSCWMAAFAFNDSPNSDPSFDSLLSTFAHELAEATSDPYVTNWYDAAGQENADICAWK
ncbi:unnamed protein product [Closterium sp. Naga37s-1]|nr:unnamed protein product [Closterium sp. Naga37s-1]